MNIKKGNLVVNIKKFIILILVLALPVSLVSCNGGGENEIGTTNGNVNDNTDAEDTVESSENITTESVPTITPEEIVEAENVAYLQTVDYLNFELTHSDAPYFVGRWFEKEINGESHVVTVTSGSALYFLVNNATSFDVNFTVITTMEEPYFAYSIDGGEPIRQHITDPTVTLPDTNRHTVRIIADGMTEGEGKWIEEKGFAIFFYTYYFKSIRNQKVYIFCNIL